MWRVLWRGMTSWLVSSVGVQTGKGPTTGPRPAASRLAA